MKKINKYLLFSRIALGFTILIHLLTYIPSLRISHGSLIFILGIMAFPPFVIALKEAEKHLRRRNTSTKNLWKHYLCYTPKWLKKGLWVVGTYVMFNFVFSLMILNEGGLTPEIHGDKYVLAYQGKVKKEVSETQYFKHKAYLLRGSSGHSILFQLMGVAIFISVQEAIKRKSNFNV